MSEPSTACWYDYPGCTYWEPCNACLNDLGLWRQITAGLKRIRHEHEHDQQERMAARLKQAADAGAARPCVDRELCTAAQPCPPCAEAGRYDRHGEVIAEHGDGSVTVRRPSDHLTWNIPADELPQWHLVYPTDDEGER